MVIALAIATLLAGTAGADGGNLRIGRTERIVFYGDSVTADTNRSWTAIVEAALRERVKGSRLAVFNRGFGGDTAGDGVARFSRDVAPCRPTLVLSCFGLNEASLAPPGEVSASAYAESTKILADSARLLGARMIFLTTPWLNEAAVEQWVDFTAYNQDGDRFSNEGEKPNVGTNRNLDTLSLTLTRTAAEVGAPVIELFNPMRETQDDRIFPAVLAMLAPDAIHPSPPGNLFIALLVLGQLDLPGLSGRIEAAPGEEVRSSGIRTNGARSSPRRIEFRMHLPFSPVYADPKTRWVLQFSAFSATHNSLTLSVTGWEREEKVAITVDGRRVAVVSGQTLAGGLDLTSLDSAPWNVRGRRLFEAVEDSMKAERTRWLDSVAKGKKYAPRAASPRKFSCLVGPSSYRVSLSPLAP